MKIIVCENYNEMSKAAADIMAKQVKENPNCVLGLATGSTPIGMYDCLADMNAKGELDFSSVRSFNLDEYYPLAADNDQSYHYFMNENLFSKINIDKNNTHILDGTCSDTEKECADFEELIEQNGGIDLQVLGIGINGHIGFNEPGENLNSRTHLTDLTENTIQANSRFFDDISDVPTQALTMGMGTILKARKIILLASGRNKHNAVASLLTSDISTEMPASMLKMHSDVTLICDTEAYSSDRIGVDIGGTEIKFGVLNEKNELIYKSEIPTDCSSAEKLTDDIADKCREIMKEFYVCGVGIGTPGRIKDGKVTAVNIPFDNLDLKALMEEKLHIPVKVSNDANCAALGEAICGAGKDTDNIVMISLGTGVGGGIIVNNSIYEGCGSAGEIGHMPLVYKGKDCPCGLKGCFEQYASAAALSQAAIKAAEENPESILNKVYKEENRMSGRLFFKAISEDCETAKDVLDDYTSYLAAGIAGIVNIFDPEAVVLSGGITNAGDKLFVPLLEKLVSEISDASIKDKIRISDLKGDAGRVGAALLF